MGRRKSKREKDDAQFKAIWLVLFGAAFVLLGGVRLGLGNHSDGFMSWSHEIAAPVFEAPAFTSAAMVVLGSVFFISGVKRLRNQRQKR